MIQGYSGARAKGWVILEAASSCLRTVPLGPGAARPYPDRPFVDLTP